MNGVSIHGIIGWRHEKAVSTVEVDIYPELFLYLCI